MDFKEIKKLSSLSDSELTSKLTALGQRIVRHHDANTGFTSFDWHNLQITSEGSLELSEVVDLTLTEDVRLSNYKDYAGIIYCICTCQKSAEAMSWDAGQKIKQPVLREIVLTICGRNDSIEPLIEKLRETYIDEDTFFDGYTTVDEKEASEAWKKQDRINRNKAEAAEAETAAKAFATDSGNRWYSKIWIFILMALSVGGYRVYKVDQQHKQEAAAIAIQRQHDEIRARREYVRSLPHVKLPGKVKGPDVKLKHTNIDASDENLGKVKAIKVPEISTEKINKKVVSEPAEITVTETNINDNAVNSGMD